MFESLLASGTRARIRVHRYVLSASCHLVLVAGAVVLTRHRGATTHPQSVDPGILFVAPQPPRELPAQPRQTLPSRPYPAAPSWQPNVAAPDLNSPTLPSRVPTVTELLQGDLNGGSSFGLSASSPAGARLATVEPLTAAAVDELVEVLEQPAPEYPSALSKAGVTGRVELEYVVDTTGHAEAASLRTLLSTHPAFEAAARGSVLATRYRPARLRGGVVRQLVRQTLSFRLADQGAPR
jgi:periplasmic protein TonB